MNAISLLIHCDIEAVPVRQMPTIWREPAPGAVEAVAGWPVEIIHQSPPCFSYSRPARRAPTVEGAK